jgi:5'(3')-deoxyribonucleotidase
MARVVSRVGVLSDPVPTADFYREEFLKHRACLAQQREYYSERAITDAELAIARVLNMLEHLCAKDDADKVMSKLLRKFDVVTGLSAWSDSDKLN